MLLSGSKFILNYAIKWLKQTFQKDKYVTSFGLKDQPHQLYIVLFNFKITGAGSLLQISQISSYLCFSTCRKQSNCLCHGPVTAKEPMGTGMVGIPWTRCPPGMWSVIYWRSQPMAAISHRGLHASCFLFSCDQLIRL